MCTYKWLYENDNNVVGCYARRMLRKYAFIFLYFPFCLDTDCINENSLVNANISTFICFYTLFRNCFIRICKKCITTDCILQFSNNSYAFKVYRSNYNYSHRQRRAVISIELKFPNMKITAHFINFLKRHIKANIKGYKTQKLPPQYLVKSHKTEVNRINNVQVCTDFPRHGLDNIIMCYLTFVHWLCKPRFREHCQLTM